MALDPSMPLKVGKKLLRENCDIGLVGTVDVFIATPLDKLCPYKKVLLIIFTGRYEEVAFKTVMPYADNSYAQTDNYQDALEVFYTMYLKLSVQQSKLCETIH